MDRPMSYVFPIKGKRQIVFILIFFFSVVVFALQNQANGDSNQNLRDEILAVYKSKGEKGLENFVKKQRDKITNKFIVDFAEAGMKERKEEWLKLCEIMAEEKKDEKTLADVYYDIGEYFSLTTNYKIAKKYFEKALQIYIKANDTVGQGSVYLSKGDMNLYTGNNSKALEMYQKSLRYFAKTEHPVGQIRQCKVYYRKGIIYSLTGKNSKAIISFDKALFISKKSGDISGQGNAFKGKGDIFFYTGDSSNALRMYTKAHFFFEKAGDILGQGNACKSKGNVYLRVGDTLKAIDMYDKALYFFKKAKDPLGQGNVFKSKGTIYSRTGEILKALAMYDEALIYFEKAGDILGQGYIYNGKGDIYLRTGEILKAIDMYNKALPFFEKFRNPVGQGSVYKGIGDFYYYTGDNKKAHEMYDKALLFFEKAGASTAQGGLYASKANIYLYSGNISKALAMYENALFLFEKGNEILGQGTVYFEKGNIYLIMGNNSKALKMYEKAFQFYEKVGYSVGQGKVYRSKGNIDFYTGNNKKALEMYEKALPFFEIAKEPIGQGNVYHGKGDIYLNNGEYSKALEMYNKALPFYEEVKSPRMKGNVYRSVGYIHLRIGNYSSALLMYDKALSLYKKCGDIKSESYALYEKAKVFVKLGKMGKALDLFEKGIANLEKVRMQTVFLEMKKNFMEKVYEQYEETAFFMLENKFYVKGFIYCEAMKYRVFLDHMAEGLVSIDKGVKPELKEKQDKLVSKLSILSKEINTTAGKQEEKKLKELKNQYIIVENEFEELLIKIRLRNPLYASVQYPEPISVQDLQEKVLRENELMLRYFIAQDKIYAFLVSKGDFKVVTLKDTAKVVNEMVEQYLISVEENNSRHMKKYSKTLYQKLFKPLETWIKNRRDIIIVPDGQLATIPFEAFIIKDKNSHKPVYLLEKYRIKYIQGASALAILRKHYQRQGTSIHFIGFGDPVYDYVSFKQGKAEKGSLSDFPLKDDEISQIHRGRYQREGGVLNRLQGSGQEVNNIAHLFKKRTQKCVVHLREQATEEKAKSPDLKEFDYIHFSCHGVLGDGFQSLVLSQIPGSSEDGYLTLNEIMNCDYHAKLVVLSACRTGKGKMERAEGVTGLTRAVMYAGTPAVVASLWDVDDDATKELMVRFYRYMLEENLSKEESLRQAKLELIKRKKYASPIYWSAFVMYGE